MFFMKRFQTLDDRGFRTSKIDILKIGNFLQFFSTNLEKIENINFFTIPCNSNKNGATKK